MVTELDFQDGGLGNAGMLRMGQDEKGTDIVLRQMGGGED